MSNATLMWSMLFIPWFTLLFMKREEVRRWFPVSMAAVILTHIINDFGVTLGFWELKESFPPFKYLQPYFYGAMPVLTIWVFKFTYDRFWLYMLANTILDIGFNFLLLDYILPSRGIIGFYILPLYSLPITLVHAAAIYLYQKWQDGELQIELVPNVKPAAVKPLVNDPSDDVDHNKD